MGPRPCVNRVQCRSNSEIESVTSTSLSASRCLSGTAVARPSWPAESPARHGGSLDASGRESKTGQPAAPVNRGRRRASAPPSPRAAGHRAVCDALACTGFPNPGQVPLMQSAMSSARAAASFVEAAGACAGTRAGLASPTRCGTRRAAQGGPQCGGSRSRRPGGAGRERRGAGGGTCQPVSQARGGWDAVPRSPRSPGRGMMAAGRGTPRLGPRILHRSSTALDET